MMRIARWAVVLTILSAAASVVPPAQLAAAQSAGRVPLARRLFREGVAAARRHDWEEARERFRRSYELAPRLMTLFNLAGAQMNTDHFVAASESYRGFLDESEGRSPEFREEAQRALEELEGQISHLRIQITGLSRADAVRLDELELPRAALDEALPVDPGAHEVTVTRDGSVIGREAFQLEAGASLEVNLAVTADESTPAERALAARLRPDNAGQGDDRQSEEEGGGILSSPLFWIVTGAVLVGGGVAAYLLVDSPGSEEPFQGSFGVITVP